jgi:hypothetical protein
MKSKTVMAANFLVALGCLIFSASIWAGDFPVITAVELKSKMDAGEELMLINPLSDIEFREGHIPGSVNIPLKDIPTSEMLPPNKDTLIITYCLGRQ